mmetsp:Transcript_65826/g.104239  ORF Transcript_65826/g.104239 Transcript_65826/m.104239 type:complete len:257 (-) Transcript_65826:1074-1844(-)
MSSMEVFLEVSAKRLISTFFCLKKALALFATISAFFADSSHSFRASVASFSSMPSTPPFMKGSSEVSINSRASSAALAFSKHCSIKASSFCLSAAVRNWILKVSSFFLDSFPRSSICDKSCFKAPVAAAAFVSTNFTAPRRVLSTGDSIVSEFFMSSSDTFAPSGSVLRSLSTSASASPSLLVTSAMILLDSCFCSQSFLTFLYPDNFVKQVFICSCIAEYSATATFCASGANLRAAAIFVASSFRAAATATCALE